MEVTPVLHVINGEHYAGAERVQDLLAASLPEFGFRVGLVATKPGRFAETRQCREAPLYELPMRNRFDLLQARRIARIVEREGYRLIHTHTPRTALIGRLASLLAGVPMVHHVHSPTARDTTRPGRNRLNAMVESVALTGVAHLVAVSESLGRQTIARGFDPARVTVVHNGVPCRPATERPCPPDGPWTLGTVALLRPRKGIEVLLEAMHLLCGDDLPLRLRVVGPFETAQYEADIRGLASRLRLDGSINWVGFSSDVAQELGRMDVFVLPSLFGEGLPMVVLEAMAAGVPLVATRVEGVPEAVRDGREGLLAEPGDAEDLAQAIRRVVLGQVDAQALGCHARQRQSESFSDRSMAAGVAQVYREVLGMKPIDAMALAGTRS